MIRKFLTVALKADIIKELPKITCWGSLRSLVEITTDMHMFSREVEHLFEGGEREILLKRLETIDLVEKELETYRSREIDVITEFDAHYPRLWRTRLENYPSFLFVAGNHSLLASRSIGIVGSRDVDEIGHDFAYDLAGEAVKNDCIIVSGGARGVDQIAMQAAIESGGNALGFLAESLWKVMGNVETREQLDSGSLCLATNYLPLEGFTVGRAMGRNKLIYAHSEATVVISSQKGSGGTWAGATEALRKKWCPVVIRSGIDIPDGNKELIAKGGRALESARSLFDRVDSSIEKIPEPRIKTRVVAEQIPLFGSFT